MNLQRNKLTMAILAITLGTMPYAVNAEVQTDNETINNVGPQIFLNDTTSNEADWEICVDGCTNPTNGAAEPNEGFNILSKDPDSDGTIRRPVTIHANARTDALRLLGNNIGMGTASPAEELHIFAPSVFSTPFFTSGNAAIRLESQFGLTFPGGDPSRIWDINGNSFGFSVEDVNNTTIPFQVGSNSPTNSLVVGNDGVGVGTNAPESKLHIVDNTAPVAVRNIVKLSNNGPVGFELEDTDAGNSWDFRTAGNGGFLVSNIGVPGSKIQVNTDGSVFLNSGGFSLNGTSNNVTVTGSVTAQGVLLTSSKHSKTDIEPIKPAEVMEKLKKVEIAEWRYKKADKNDRHISPMAEDFYSLFQLGPDDKHINPNDLASVAIIAAKELQKQSETMTSKTAALKAENKLLKDQLAQQGEQLAEKNDALQQRLASLEKLVTNLAMGEGLLANNGNKIVLK